MSTDVETELGPFLQPIAGEAPCGPALRYDPIFTEVRMAREEDDPSLPMGQWERPLKKADWPLIEERCGSFLAQKSKDLQIATWLLEAWTRQRGFEGLEKGLALMRELTARYWDCVHPRIEDGDADARVAPLQWLNESIALTVRVHVTIVTLAGRKKPRVSLADWERLTAAELAASGDETPRKPAEGEDPPLTRAEVLVSARSDKSGVHAKQLALVRASLAHVAAINAFFDGKLGLDAPNMNKLRGTLETIERVLLQFVPAEPAPQAAAAATTETPMATQDDGSGAPAPAAGTIPPILTTASVAGVKLEGVANREDAYKALEALAQYLGQIEPHSPTPYLIRRAVNWGRMPLPELMQEILREEGDLNRMTQLLGLNRDT